MGLTDMHLNTQKQDYKGVPIWLIPKSSHYYGTRKAKRFALGTRTSKQSVWIPNTYLHDDGTIKPDADIDFVFRTALRQNKFKLSHTDIPGWLQ